MQGDPSRPRLVLPPFVPPSRVPLTARAPQVLRFPPDAGETIAQAKRRERDEDLEARMHRARVLAWLAFAMSLAGIAIGLYALAVMP